MRYTVWYSITDEPGVRAGVAEVVTAQWHETVNSDTSISVVTPLFSGHPDERGIVPGETVLWILRDGVPVAAPGWLLGGRLDLAGETAEWTATGLMSYFDRRQAGELSFTSADILAIARALIIEAQAVPVGNIGLLNGVNLSGVTGDLVVPASDREYYGDLFRRLVDEFGFDWRISPSFSGENLAATLDLTYPPGGRTTGLTIENGTHIDLTSAEWDASGLADTVTITGGGSGAVQPAATAVTADRGRRPLTELVESNSDLVDTTALASLAARTVARTHHPILRPAGRFRPHPDVGIGKIATGDIVRLRADIERFQINEDYRVVSQTFSIGTDGTETIDAEFVLAELFA